MLPSGLPDVVGDDECLARFLVQSSQFSTGAIKPATFMPNPKDRESSVFRHGRAPREGLLALGKIAVGTTRTLYGAAVIAASAVRAAGLDVSASEPPERHAAIRGWPWNESDPDNSKARQKELAMLLADAAGAPELF